MAYFINLSVYHSNTVSSLGQLYHLGLSTVTVHTIYGCLYYGFRACTVQGIIILLTVQSMVWSDTILNHWKTAVDNHVNGVWVLISNT